jgi:hypothetical protein
MHAQAGTMIRRDKIPTVKESSELASGKLIGG